jgi:NAD(P)-dependent dehydrogenase (short-subunit alcohol dehydrogenase family)
MKIIITGSEGLIGKEIGKYLAKKNKIIKVDLSLGHDLTDEKFVKKWFKENKANYLINCFALNDHVAKERKKETLFNITLESFSKYMDINLTALFSVCREFARNNKKGAIVNYTSSSALVSPRPDMYEGAHKHIGYSISKAGVINMTKFLATHLAPNIRVNCVAPGGVQFNQEKKFIDRYSKHTPMKRMMKKSELNGLMEFLCSNNSSYATGATFVMDGGWTVW